MKPFDLRCEYEVNPLGIDVVKPRLSWKLQDDRRGAAQSAYRVLVALTEVQLARDEADLWDSGEVESDQSVWVTYQGEPLSSRERALWKVQVRDEQGNWGDFSEVAWWELGLLNQSEWQGEWIGAHLRGGPQTAVPCPYLRKSFEAVGKVKAARLYVTALGLYEFYVNGQRIGNDVFTPGWTEYAKRVQYHTYDVTSLVQSGTNACGAILGDGWYSGHIEFRGRQRYGDRPKLLAQLVVTFDDGREEVIATDDSWKYAFGPILESDLLMGEQYDARLELGEWSAPVYDDTKWETVQSFPAPDIRIAAHVGPPVRPQEELKPLAEPTVIHKWPANDYIFDLGQNMVGRVCLKVAGERGTTVRLRFAETLDKDGNLYTENLRSARATDYYTLKGEDEEVWESRFTFHGFRYVELTGLKEAPSAEAITGIVLNSDIPRTGEWSSNDALLNQLQHNIWWGQKGNFLEVPTDCPQRDERLGWTGDAQVFVRTAAFNADVAGFFAKWLNDIDDTQLDNGAVPCIAPNTADHEGVGDGGPAWSDATVICPWTMYLAYGDKAILERHYQTFVRYIQHLDDLSRPHGMIRSHPDVKGFEGFGDWLAVDGAKGWDGNTPKDLIGTAFFAYSSRLLSKIAQVLGKDEDVAKYETLFAEVKQAFNRRFVTPEGLVTGNTQTAYLLALHFDLLPEEVRANAAQALVRDIKRKGDHLSTGFVGSPYINHVLSDTGHEDVAYTLLHQTSWPSWLYAVTQGATTIWERWDGWTHDKGFQDKAMNSFNHYAYGAIGAWLYGKAAGIEIDESAPAYKHLVLKPHPGGRLSEVHARLNSVYGVIESRWTLEDGTFRWKVTVPPNTRATVYVPTTDAAALLEGDVAPSQSEGVQYVGAQDGYAQLQVVAGTYEFSAPLTSRDEQGV